VSTAVPRRHSPTVARWAALTAIVISFGLTVAVGRINASVEASSARPAAPVSRATAGASPVRPPAPPAPVAAPGPAPPAAAAQVSP